MADFSFQVNCKIIDNITGIKNGFFNTCIFLYNSKNKPPAMHNIINKRFLENFQTPLDKRSIVLYDFVGCYQGGVL